MKDFSHSALILSCHQVGAVLTSPSGIPLELVSSEGAVAMAAAVPAEADVGDVAQAKLAVLQSATHVQVGVSLAPSVSICEHLQALTYCLAASATTSGSSSKDG